MKITTFSVAVAVVCIGFNPANAQTHANRLNRPTPAPTLVSGANQIPSSDSPTTAEINAIDNPFDFLDAPQPEHGLRTEASSPSDTSRSNSPASDPSSLPVVRHPRQGIVDAIVDHAALDGVMDASQSPVFWTQSAQTPNPVASILLREQCVQGLWDGYQAERARECAAMWAHLAGHQHCGNACGSCAAGGCQSGACAGPRNRYREACDSAPVGCSSCAINHATGQPAGPQVLPASRPMAPVPAAVVSAPRPNVAWQFTPLMR